METETDLLSRVYAAFNCRDIETVLASLHPDVDWPNGWEGGRLTGRAAVRDYWVRQWAEIDPAVMPEAFTPLTEGRIAARVRQTVRSQDGALLSDSVIYHVYGFKDGLVLRMDIEAS